MNDWEYLRVAVHYRDDGNIDYVARQGNSLSSIATHQEMRGHFNIAPEEWGAYLQKLKGERWELDQVERQDQGENETYVFKRIKE
jgi:hypothetical protein